MRERPQAALFQALRELGYRVDSPNNKLPVTIHGGGGDSSESAPQRRCSISIVDSSQFASALMLCARVGGWEVAVTGENAAESPYVVMTQRLIEVFPFEGGEFRVEPDASSGSYFWAAAWLQSLLGEGGQGAAGGRIRVANWPESGWQVDARFPRCLPLPEVLSREVDLGDSIMTAIVLGPLSGGVRRFTDLGRLRVQECERVAALRTELTRCGARVEEEGDTLIIHPSPLHGAAIETYDDHRMAMCFAILGLKVPGIRLHNPACVKKTFPNFFQKLAAPPPSGLGATILDAATGRRLRPADLFAQ